MFAVILGGGKEHLYVAAVSAVTAVPKENQGQNAYKSWFVVVFSSQGIIDNKKHLGY